MQIEFIFLCSWKTFILVDYNERMFRPKYFFPYVIQIGMNETILFVNYATDVRKAFLEFIRKHPQIRDSKLRVDLFDANASILPPEILESREA